jgi:hypothetical protein
MAPLTRVVGRKIPPVAGLTVATIGRWRLSAIGLTTSYLRRIPRSPQGTQSGAAEHSAAHPRLGLAHHVQAASTASLTSLKCRAPSCPADNRSVR